MAPDLAVAQGPEPVGVAGALRARLLVWADEIEAAGSGGAA
jgi:hypothetical protein